MSLTLLVSIGIRLLAMVWSIFLLLRLKDWRMGFLTCMLGLMALRQLLVLTAVPWSGAINLSGSRLELPGLIVSVMGFLAVVFLDRLLGERKRAVDALQASETQLRAIAESVGTALFIFTDQCLLYVNAAAEALSGYTRGELLGLPFRQLLHPASWDLVQAPAVGPQPAGSGLCHHEMKMLTKGGAERWVDYIEVGIVFDGQPAALGTAFDISERKRAEEALSESEKRYRLLVDSSHGLIGTHDLSGQILSLNPAVARTLGYCPQDGVPRNLREFIAPSTLSSFESYLERIRQQGVDRGLMRVVTRSGEERIWMYHNVVITEADMAPYVLGHAQDITDLVRAEERLRASEGRFRALVEHSLAGIYIFQDKKLHYVNPKCAEMFGYTQDELLTHCPDGHALMAEEDLSRIRSYMREGIRGDVESFRYTFHGIRKDGTRIDVEGYGMPIEYQGRPAIIGTLLDITARKRMDDTLLNIAKGVSGATGEQFFRSLVEHLAQSLEADYAFVAEVGPEDVTRVHTLAVYSQGTCTENFTYDLAGTPCESVIGQRSFTYPSGVRQQFPTAPWLAAMAVEGYAGASLVDATGRTLGLLVVLYRQPLHHPSFVESVLQIFAARATAELERKDAEQQMRFQAQLLDNVRESVIAADLDGRITYWGKGAEELYGYTAAEVMEREVTLIVDTPKERADALQRMQSVRDTGSWRGQYVQQRKDGSEFWAETVIALVKDAQGLPCGFVGIDRDITERRRLEEQLRQAHKMEAIGTLAGGVAHDFNNILAAMLGYTELAMYDVSQQSMPWHNLQEVIRAGQRAKNLVQQILTFSRQSSHERKPVLLQHVVQEVLALLRASLPSTIDLRQRIAPNAGAILADATQIHQVLMNLCANAEHAMRDTGGRLDVCVDTVHIDAHLVAQHPTLQIGPYVRLVVRDTGHGLAPQVLARIFEPFFTTKKVGEGTGMGLAVVHGIVSSHNGAIVAESTPGQGTTFTIYLPQIAVEADVPSQPSLLVTPRGKGCILFVDDEEPLVRIGQDSLSRLGYEVIPSTSSVEALHMFRAHPERFDVVVTDQTMPHMTGEQLVQELRRIRPDVPIILCTGFSYVIDDSKAADLGIDAFCMKPLAPLDLAQIIHEVVERRGRQDIALPPSAL